MEAAKDTKGRIWRGKIEGLGRRERGKGEYGKCGRGGGEEDGKWEEE
jgi:hypothetical protein